ncbi:drug resistance transporter, EmrB/QacA subfamily [Chitinophaga terrae (ex Kim and Jung 2007)]|uniref:Drug resistance transporter, EmrB/QacA subfamily n=1 Tax=Chitinophaga terrae (ex Kim and Jung 2007) TaxID=408074 RepID=A0A1H4GTE5_9BACT|nr:MFS transporter [Chitinophaga terrae (ex Kim and Jung 2007)]GEP93680.1 MFS transporter [Chitinophaga terrae (ex Kim and Jung 2007)]SEB11902.1 drug resistance transporter, EmrB/QacA subfamily [Chitinophaga terrae (ex Kim and Jung 2007)]
MEQHSNKWLQHFILLTAPLLTVIDIFIVNIAMPSIKQSFNASDGAIELVVAAYLLGFGSFQVTGSRAGDIFGRKKIFLWGMFFFVLTSCICGLAPNVIVLIAARFFQGVSGSFMQSQALAYVQVLFPERKERTKAIGYIGITLGIASVMGQFLGGLFSGLHTFIEGWRFIFLVNLPIGIVAFLLAKKHLENTKLNFQERFDYSGVTLFTLALGFFIYPLTEGREQDYPLWSFAMLLASLILFFVFIVNQKNKLKKQQKPLMDIRLFKIRDYNIGLILVAFYFAMHTSYLLVSTFYLQSGLNLTSMQAGMYFVVNGVLFMLSSFLSVRLVNKFGKKPVQIGVALMIIVYILQIIFLNNQTNEITFLFLLSFQGFCGGLVLPSLINLTLKNIPHHFVGIASGMYNTIQQTASSMGVCFIGGLFFTIAKAKNDFVTAFHYSLYAGIGCLLISFALLIVIEDLKKKIWKELSLQDLEL